MNIFNSLGSNYNFKFVLKTLFARNEKDSSSDLVKYLENKYKGKVILVYKGREALELALKVARLPKKSSIVINGFTCYAVYEVIKKLDYSIEYIDIDDSLNFTPIKLREALKKNPKVKAVIIQNTLGYPCQIEEIAKICRARKIVLIEDIAHSVGALYANGKEAGTVGDFVVLSFSQDKMIDAVSGGALVVRNKKYQGEIENGFKKLSSRQQRIDRLYPLFTFFVRNMYQFGIGKIIHFLLKRVNLLSKPVDSWDPKNIHSLPSWYCYLIKLQFDEMKNNFFHKKQIAKIYARKLNKKFLSNSIVRSVENSSNLRFPILVDKRKKLIEYLRQHGIFVSDIWYDSPIAPKRYMDLTDYEGQCRESEKIASRILNLPTHRNVSEKDARYISQKINQWLRMK